MNSVIPSIQLNILRNFDLSIVMPFYKKYEDFRVTLPRNCRYFQRNGIEVIIVMDAPDDMKKVLELVKQYPFINWKIFVNPEPHPWRNPAKAINVGIRSATRKYIMVMGPDSELFTDAVFNLRYMAELYPRSFFIGKVLFTSHHSSISRDNLHTFPLFPYGSILTAKEHLLSIEGYNEQYQSWGGDDDNVRTRLEYSGIRRMLVPDAILVHREKKTAGAISERHRKAKNIPAHIRSNIFVPSSSPVNKESWGVDFSDCIYDYQHNAFAEELCRNYLESFPKSWIRNGNIFRKKYRILALVPVYNEQYHLPAVLNHLAKYVDGIILLDDESTDSSYDKAVCRKLILKVSKRRGKRFNDLENRNILLNLASFFKTTWLLFSDADERFDQRWNAFRQLQDDQEIIVFPLVHLWNNSDHYLSDMELTPGLPKGIMLRSRMFQSKGRLQLVYNRELHFMSVPYGNGNKFIAPMLIRHYGTMKKKDRNKKYAFYEKEDLRWKYFQKGQYEFLKKNGVEVSKIRLFDMEKIKFYSLNHAQ